MTEFKFEYDFDMTQQESLTAVEKGMLDLFSKTPQINQKQFSTYISFIKRHGGVHIHDYKISGAFFGFCNSDLCVNSLLDYENIEQEKYYVFGDILTDSQYYLAFDIFSNSENIYYSDVDEDNVFHNSHITFEQLIDYFKGGRADLILSCFKKIE